MSDIEHARALLAMAAKDLRALKGMDEPETFADEIFGFHAQQTVEKSLKAWIAALGAEYPLTHNIARLLAILEDLEVRVEPLWDLAEYTAFAVEFRYGALVEGEELLNRPKVINRVQELFEQVELIIGPH
jgi:HEPN domain-containing protein